MITFTELAALGIAVQLIVTILKQRAPGMTLNRMPLLVWAILVTSFMTVFAMPAVMLASTFLIMDRLIGTHFFNPAEGGDALLWQHLFWFFGHPEVYIIFMPALGLRLVDRRDLRAPPGVRLHGDGALAGRDRLPRVRPVGPPHVRDRAAAARRELLHRRQHADRDPERDPDLLLDRDLVGRPAAARDAAPVRARLLLHLRDRRPQRRDARLGAARCAGPRHLLRRGAFPLRADRRRGVPAVRRVLLLVSQGQRAHAERARGPLELLAVLHRLQPRLLPDAPARADRHAAPGLHLSGGARLGRAQSAGQHRRPADRGERRPVRRQRGLEPCATAQLAGDNPWHAGTLEWATRLAAAALELPAHPGGRGPSSRCGRSRRRAAS